MVETVLRIVEAALSIWASKEKTKYADEILRIKRAWYEEYNKDISVRSDAVLVNLQRELRDVAESVAAGIHSTDLQDK